MMLISNMTHLALVICINNLVALQTSSQCHYYSSAYNPSRAHGLSPFNHFPEKNTPCGDQTPVFVNRRVSGDQCICSMINRRHQPTILPQAIDR
ncbi:hypothetical protein ACMD2_25218, partial [Ananas comosus]